jgi:hypothetical protein
LSSTVPLTITFLNAGWSNSMVPIASRLKNQPRVWSTPSAMKSAGKRCLKSSWFSNGKWYCATGIEPESNQTSIRSVTRRISPPHFWQGSVTRSMYGRWRSSWSVRPNSATEPIQRRSSHCWQIHMGSGVPQYRQRESDQSTSVSNQFAIRPVPT